MEVRLQIPAAEAYFVLQPYFYAKIHIWRKATFVNFCDDEITLKNTE